MSELRILLEGIGILLFGWFCIIWQIALILSCIIIGVLVSGKLGLNGAYWWASTIIIFSLLNRIVFYGNGDSKQYEELVENYVYKYKTDDIVEECKPDDDIGEM